MSQVPRGRLILCVLLPFAAGYYISYLFRSINALIAADLTSELGLSAGDLGSAHIGVFPDVRGGARSPAACSSTATGRASSTARCS